VLPPDLNYPHPHVSGRTLELSGKGHIVISMESVNVVTLISNLTSNSKAEESSCLPAAKRCKCWRRA